MLIIFRDNKPVTDIMEYTHRLEEEIIGTIVYKSSLFFEVEDILDSRYFFYANHQELVELILIRLRKDITSVDLMQLALDFSRLKIPLDIIDVVTTAHLRSQCEELRNLYTWRELKKIAGQIGEKEVSRNQEDTINAIKETFEQLHKLEEVVFINSQSRTKDMLAASMDFINFLDNQSPNILKTGLTDLDMMLGGFKPGELIVVGARPSMGKTALSLTFIDFFGLNNIKTLYMSFEMTILDMMKRLYSLKSMVNLHKINLKNDDGGNILEYEEYRKIADVSSILSNYPVVWHDQTCTVSEIRLLAKQQLRGAGLNCIIIDHLGKVKPDNLRAPRYEQISQIINDLKNLSKELCIPVVVLSQLSRNLESRKDKRPFLADLRESGEIEQEADVVMFLYRDKYYNQDTKLIDCMEIIIDKHRNGPTGTILVGFLDEYARVFDLPNETKRYYLEVITENS